MNKVINYLGLRKVAINLQLDKLPSAELQEELRQVDEALLVLSNVLRQSEQSHTCKYVKRIGESCNLNNNCKYPNCE